MFKSVFFQKLLIVLLSVSLITTIFVMAATNDFVATGDFTVSGVTFGATTTDIAIVNGSEAESWSFDNGTFTVTNPGIFKVRADDSAVKTIQAKQGSTVVGCEVNSTPGTSYLTLPTAAGVYTVNPSAITSCSSYCATVAYASSYNSFPTCGAASCQSGYTLSGSGSSAVCVVVPAAIPIFSPPVVTTTPTPTEPAPTETPTETPTTETPTEPAPTETPTETPTTETPTEPAPTETPTETPTTETPTEPAPTETPTETPAETPVVGEMGINNNNANQNVSGVASDRTTNQSFSVGSGGLAAITQVASVIITNISQVTEQITKEVKQIISQIAAPVQQAVQELRESPKVVETIEDIATPIAQATVAVASVATITVVATSAATTNIAITVAQTSAHVSEFLRLSALLSALGIKRRKPWGKVYDFYTRKPIVGAQIQLVKKQFDKVVETQITDEEGRFSFLVSPKEVDQKLLSGPDEYYFHISKEGYSFEKNIIPNSNIYYGQILKVEDLKKGVLNFEIPLKKVAATAEDEVSGARQALNKILHFLQVFFDSINIYLLIIGTLLALAVTIIIPSKLNISVLAFYLLMDIVKMIFSFVSVKSFGVVKDIANSKPLPLTTIRVFEKTRNILLGTKVANELGEFNFLLTPGTYYITAMKEGYSPYQSEPVVFKKSNVISLDISLKR